MADIFDKVYKDNPVIVDAIVLALQEYFYNILPYNQEEDDEDLGTGRYRILRNTSDDYAIRKRILMCSNNSYPILPFTNFRWTDIDVEQDIDKYSNFGFNTGIQDDDIMALIKFVPTQLEFESTTWVHKNIHMFAIRKLIQKEISRKKTKLTLEKYFFIDGEPIDLSIFIEFNKPDIDKYSDIDWLDTNKINAVTHAFKVKYQDIYINRNVFITKKVVLQVKDEYDNLIVETELT